MQCEVQDSLCLKKIAFYLQFWVILVTEVSAALVQDHMGEMTKWTI